MTDDKLNERKKDHLELTNKSQTLRDNNSELRELFDYEPLLSGFPRPNMKLDAPTIAGKKMKVPLWISSMTGGTGAARAVNQHLATICGEFGLGMGLGSCRPLLESDEFFADFALRPLIGDDLPFFANIGFAQIVELINSDEKFAKWIELCRRLQVDGFFIHLNPLQEWHQPEGDYWYESPLVVIEQVLEKVQPYKLALGIKEVGQGMGPRSLSALLKLPLAVVEFSAFGGTNFSYLEQLRAQKKESPLSFVGHSAREMLDCANYAVSQQARDIRCESIIISGGIRTSLEGFYLTQKSSLPAAYGMASPFLQAATQGEQAVRDLVQKETSELRMAAKFLHSKEGAK